MSSLLGERRISPVQGIQEPRHEVFPAEWSTVQADLVIEFCEAAGLILDPWQQLWLRHGMAEQSPGKWSAFETAAVVSRQNGKGEVLMARELGGMFLLEEKIQIHSAHQFKTCREAFLKMKWLVQSSPLLEQQVKTIRNANGEEGIELRNGARLQYVARSNNSGRGFTGDLIVFDEAQILGNGPIEDMMPTLSTKPRAQVWYAGTTGTPDSTYLARLRRRALKGDAGRLAYLEWSADEDSFDPRSRDDWARANPALGIRISEEYIEDEQKAMSPEGFARERLSIGDWPSDDNFRLIPEENWLACEDASSARPVGIVASLEVDQLRGSAVIAVCGVRPDGLPAVEIAVQRAGLDWVADRVDELDQEWSPDLWVVDKGGPAGTFLADMQSRGIRTVVPAVAEVAQAAEGFYDAVLAGRVRHTGDTRLSTAVAGAARRPIKDAWAWGRRASTTDISPLVACSFALWGFTVHGDGLSPGDLTII
jgi:phage terminase large subunit-like protein